MSAPEKAPEPNGPVVSPNRAQVLLDINNAIASHLEIRSPSEGHIRMPGPRAGGTVIGSRSPGGLQQTVSLLGVIADLSSARGFRTSGEPITVPTKYPLHRSPARPTTTRP